MLGLVIALTVAGGVLPLWAVARAVDAARMKYGVLDQQLSEIDAILEASRTNGETTERTTARMYAVREPTIRSFGQQMYTAETVERTLYDQLRRPAYTAALGVLCGMTGSLLSLAL